MSAPNDLYFRQLLSGRDFARGDAFAQQMANFVYLVGDPATREAVLVDPAWDVRGLVDLAAADGYRVVGALVTHFHPDHVGGDFFGRPVQGAAELLAVNPCKLWVNVDELDGVKFMTGCEDSDLAPVRSGDTMHVGGVEVRFVHTPGHTPGSQCFLVRGRLVSGDTLFIGGCGRVDLPGSDPDQMYESLTQKLARLPEETVLYPGHDYADRPTSTIADEKRTNVYLRVRSLDDWRRLQRMNG